MCLATLLQGQQCCQLPALQYVVGHNVAEIFCVETLHTFSQALMRCNLELILKTNVKRLTMVNPLVTSEVYDEYSVAETKEILPRANLMYIILLSDTSSNYHNTG